MKFNEIKMDDFNYLKRNMDSSDINYITDCHKKLIGKKAQDKYSKINDCGVEAIRYLLKIDWGRSIVYEYEKGAIDFMKSRYLSNYINNSNINYKLNVDFTNKELEIENVQALINNNTNNIQSILHDSEVIIISLGNNDYKTEEYKTILEELNNLFNSIRNINTKEIIYISPYVLKNTTYIKEICHKYNIIFINGSSFINKPNLLAQLVYKKIDSSYKRIKLDFYIFK